MEYTSLARWTATLDAIRSAMFGSTNTKSTLELKCRINLPPAALQFNNTTLMSVKEVCSFTVWAQVVTTYTVFKGSWFLGDCHLQMWLNQLLLLRPTAIICWTKGHVGCALKCFKYFSFHSGNWNTTLKFQRDMSIWHCQRLTEMHHVIFGISVSTGDSDIQHQKRSTPKITKTTWEDWRTHTYYHSEFFKTQLVVSSGCLESLRDSKSAPSTLQITGMSR